MCGLTGFLARGPWSHRDAALPLLERMATAISSRGPDDFGAWHDPVGIGLAHRRLSIVDLSSAGHQPMVCQAERLVMVFNGEIYNHLALRAELRSLGRAPIWRGHSDTETLLAGFLVWGVRATIERCVGMFAFAVWDRSEQILHLGRDRLGEKPLYYGWQGEGETATFLFGSELKSLKAHPAFRAEVDRNALSLLMRHGYITAPHSIYQGIHKLPPGHLLTISLDRHEPRLSAYWSFPGIVEDGVATPVGGGLKEVTDELELLLKSAVGQQMVADVPLGAFLSGGIDSSVIVALMQAQSNQPVKTFSIGFHEKGYNEAEYARGVAKHLRTDHTELYVTAQQALNVIPKLPRLYCEPLADPSQIPTFLVAQLARQQVTVALSGDGGDELFGGYTRYNLSDRLWSRMSHIPRRARGLIASSVHLLSQPRWNSLFGPVQTLLPAALRKGNIGEKLYKGADLLRASTIDELYLKLMTHWEPQHVVLGGNEPHSYLQGTPLSIEGLSTVQRMMALDTMTYLPDDILAKVDRAAMGVSLETRTPFLDHRVVEFSWRIPQSMKLHHDQTKQILREVLYRYVPKALIERPKMGFGVPIDVWLRGPLRDWAEDLLSESRLHRDGFFKSELVREKWAQHLSGQCDWQYLLWDVLMFQAWHDGEAHFNAESS